MLHRHDKILFSLVHIGFLPALPGLKANSVNHITGVLRTGGRARFIVTVSKIDVSIGFSIEKPMNSTNIG